ncbi:agrin-like [Mercenaria mercenaria]|uniref:agrin-like n=1 Tax=Mercenaria mercenaria TaxID=6596 RepID=UPI001E1D7796|nr:agrin-like [Mercenaria mercenaria]
MVLSIAMCLISFSGFACADVFYSCDYINIASTDCSRFSDDITCGTNLVTYKNKCEFSKAHCADNSINLKHYGPCNGADGTTSSPVDAAGAEVVFDFMCTSLSHISCTPGGSKVCASNGRIYENYCEYEKAKCTHRELNVLDCQI